MACKIENLKYKGENIESQLGEFLQSIYGSLDKAKEVYDKLGSPSFIEKFGNWIDEDIEGRTTDSGEPALIRKVSKDGSYHYYFITQNGEPFYLEVPEFKGLSDVDLSNEVNQITSSLAYVIYRENFKKDFETIDNSSFNIKKTLHNYLTGQKELFSRLENKEAKEEILDRINIVENNLDSFITEIRKFFSERKINIVDDIIEDIEQTNQEEGLQGGDIIQSFERNSKDNATANVKLMLSFLPRIDNITGNVVKGDYLNEPVFRSFDEIYKELQKELADITNVTLEGEVGDIFNVMKARINDMAQTKKSYEYLLNILENVDENKKTEFIQAFYLSKVNFYTTTVDKGNKYKFTVQNVSDVSSPESRQLTEYYSAFKVKHVDNNKIKKESLARFESRITDIINSARKNNRLNRSKTSDEFYSQFMRDIDTFKTILQDLGVSTVTDDILDFFFHDGRLDRSGDMYKVMYNQFVGGALVGTRRMLNSILSATTLKINPFKDESFFRSLAEAEVYFKEDLSDNTIFSNGNTYWTFMNPSYISNKINQYKENPELLNQLLTSSYGATSVWAEHLLGLDKTEQGDYRFAKNEREKRSGRRLNEFSLGLFNSFQERDKGEEGNDNKNIRLVDQFIDRFNKVMLGATPKELPIYSTITPADKSRMHEIKIDYFKFNTAIEVINNQITFDPKITKIFVDYFESEVNRARVAYSDIEEGNNLTIYYHTDTKGEVYDENGDLAGNAFKMAHIFPELDISNMTDQQRRSLGLFNADRTPMNTQLRKLTPDQRSKISKLVNKTLSYRVKNQLENLRELKMLEDKSISNKPYFKPVGIDSRILERYAPNPVMISRESALNLVSDFTINSLIANIEYTKLFTGDPTYYKNVVDFFKRVPATYTDGKNLRLGMTKNDHLFDIAVIEDQEKASDYIDDIESSLSKTDLSDSEKEYILNAYKNVDQTDAQGWITFDRWFFLISRLGKWNDKVQSIYNKVKANKSLSPDELKYTAQPLKGVYFGLVNNVPTYLKYSQAVLIPQLTEGTQLDNLRKNMESNSIDESIVLSGVKVGASIPNKITENDDIAEDFTLNTLTLNNTDWKLQQDLPVKNIKPTLLGSQIKKNILSSVEDTDTYNRINTILSDLSTKGIDQLSIELGKDDRGKVNPDRVYSILERELLDRGTAANALLSVQKNLPIEAIPSLKNKLYNILFSKVRSSAVKIKTNGGSFIQLSNFGLDKFTADKKGVTWLVEPDALKPPVIEYDIEGKGHIRPGQILISHSQIAKYIPNYKDFTMEQLQKKIDSRLLRAIGYRIPNQGQSSNDPLQIVGILPESMGDTIVAYTEITKKTGSDFDIDKVYVMLPNVNVRLNKSNFKKAKEYIRSIDLSIEEMYDELHYTGYDISKFNNLEQDANAIQEVFIREHIFNSGSELEYHDEFITEYEIGQINSINYLEPREEYGENSTKHLQNLLFEEYWKVLTKESTYGDLITPIDFPHIKDKINELHGGGESNGRNLEYYDPFYQLQLKFAYNLGKRGVGITANMLVDHNIGKFVKMEISDSITDKDYIFDNEYSEKINGTQYKIKDTISAFLNAFVDIAKDPYINRGNFNSFTSPVAFFLIRAGYHPDWVVAFIGNPVLKELSKFMDIYESKSIPKKNPKLSAFDIILQKYSKMIGGEPNIKTNYSLEELEGQITGTQTPLEAAEVLVLFDRFVTLAKKLNDSVQLSRFDTLGAGKDIIDLTIFENQMRELYANQGQDGNIYGHFKKYGVGDQKTYLGTNAENTVLYLKDIMDANPDLFLMGSTPVKDLMNQISIETLDSRGGSKGLLTDEKLGKLIQDELYKYIMSDFPPFKVNQNPIDYIKSTIEDIYRYKQQEAEYDAIDRNFFVEQISIYPLNFGIDNKNKSIELQDRLYRSARDLMEEDPELADRIFISSFLANGFSNRLIDIKQYIPYQWFLNNGIREFIREKHGQFKNSSIMLQSFKNQFVRNNSDSNVLAPKINKSFISGIDQYDKKIAFTLNNGTFKASYQMGPTNIDFLTAYPKFLKFDNGLYKLIGYIENNPVYTQSTRLGYNDNQSFISVREYKYNNSVIDSYFNENAGNESTATSYKAASEISERSDFIPISEVVYGDRYINNVLEKDLESIMFSEMGESLSIQPIDNNPISTNTSIDYTHSQKVIDEYGRVDKVEFGIIKNQLESSEVTFFNGISFIATLKDRTVRQYGVEEPITDPNFIQGIIDIIQYQIVRTSNVKQFLQEGNNDMLDFTKDEC